jgi:hypothetical protein
MKQIFICTLLCIALLPHQAAHAQAKITIAAGVPANPTFSGLTSNGLIKLIGQPGTPAAPLTGTQNMYADSTGAFALQGSNGFALSLSKSRLTANHRIFVQNKDYTLADSADVAAQAATITANTGTISTTNTRTALFLGAYTTTARDAISSPAAGSQIYNTTNGYMEYYDSFWGWMPVYPGAEWKSRYGIEYFNEMGQSSVTDGFFSSGSLAGGNASGASQTHPSVSYMSVAAVGNTSALFNNNNNNTNFTLGNGLLVYETLVMFPSLSNSTDRYQFLFGIGKAWNSATQTDGVWITYDEGGIGAGSTASANFQCATAATSVRTFTDAGVAVVAGTWYRLRIEINAAATSVVFKISGSTVATITTTIPTVSIAPFISMIKSVGTTARTGSIDYISLKQKFTTAR